MPTILHSPIQTRKSSSSVVTSDSRSHSPDIRDVTNVARRVTSETTQSGTLQCSGGAEAGVSAVEKCGDKSDQARVEYTAGKEDKTKGGGKRCTTNVKGLRLDVCGGSSSSDDVGVGTTGIPSAPASQTGLVTTVIKSLPLDAELSLSPSLSRSNSNELNSNTPTSVCKGGPGKATCGLEVREGQMGVECDICHYWYHTYCQSVSKPAYNALNKHPVIAFVCTLCKAIYQSAHQPPSFSSIGVQAECSMELHSAHVSPRNRVTGVHGGFGSEHLDACAQTSPVGLVPSSLPLISHQEDHIRQLDISVTKLSASVEEQVKKMAKIQDNIQLLTRSVREQEALAVDQSNMMKRVLTESQNQKFLYSDAVKKSCDKMIGEVKDKLSAMPGSNSKSSINIKEAQTVSKVFDDFLDKNKRARNLVIHNFPEQEGSTVVERSQADMSLFSSMIKETLHMNVRPTKSFRAGKFIPNKDRLLIITLENEDVKYDVLRMASQLRTCEGWRRVFITPDLTYKERQQQKMLREELWKRREAGESNLCIRRGRIVKTGQSSDVSSVCHFPALTSAMSTSRSVATPTPTAVGEPTQRVDAAAEDRHLPQLQQDMEANRPCTSTVTNAPSQSHLH